MGALGGGAAPAGAGRGGARGAYAKGVEAAYRHGPPTMAAEFEEGLEEWCEGGGGRVRPLKLISNTATGASSSPCALRRCGSTPEHRLATPLAWEAAVP
jgi:hypothetical protein